MVFENWSDIGILIEIIGFILVLFFWRLPTYSNLHLWRKFQVFYKLIYGEKKYVKRISENALMNDDDSITRSTGISLNRDNAVPRSFLNEWKIMKIMGFVIVIIGLFLQFSCFDKYGLFFLNP